ncbi:MAG: serine/threonine-protein phosphatase [Chromatiales bacterium]|nr:MAG: serine/threonine-protein phosphatase [Chromatiales bacterium]
MAERRKKTRLVATTLDKPKLYLGEQDDERAVYRTKLGQVAAVSVGDAEKNGPNEDSAAIIPVNDTHVVLAVADGVGGLAGARRASNLTVQALRKALNSNAEAPGRSLRSAILDGIDAANSAILESGGGGASTLALAEIGPDYVRPYHVGDSIVLICGQRGKLKLYTTPHSPVGFAMEAGLLDEKEAMEHTELNLIFNVIGSSDMRVEVGSELPLAPRDTLLLASDGLTDNVLQDEIIAAVRSGPLDRAINRVANLALERMRGDTANTPSKPDDLTALLFRRHPPR